MKTYSDSRPHSLMPLGDGNYHYHYNIEETQSPAMEDGGESRTQYKSDAVFVKGEPTVAKIVNSVVHETYSDEEISLMNAQHQAAGMGLDEEPEKYGDYLSLVVATRTAAATAIAELRQAQQAAGEATPQPIVTETPEAEVESISQEQVGSVEEVLGDLVGQ